MPPLLKLPQKFLLPTFKRNIYCYDMKNQAHELSFGNSFEKIHGKC